MQNLEVLDIGNWPQPNNWIDFQNQHRIMSVIEKHFIYMQKSKKSIKHYN